MGVSHPHNDLVSYFCSCEVGRKTSLSSNFDRSQCGNDAVGRTLPTFEPGDEAPDAWHEVEAEHESDRDGDGRAVDAADVDLRTKFYVRFNEFGDFGRNIKYCLSENANDSIVQGDYGGLA